jgi:DNA anti-recombination protein RmuC
MMDNITKYLDEIKKVLKEAFIIDDEECFDNLENVTRRTRVAEHAYVNAKRNLDNVKAEVKTSLAVSYEKVREIVDEASKTIAEKKQEKLDILDKNTDSFSEIDSEKDLNSIIEDTIEKLEDLKKDTETNKDDEKSCTKYILYILYMLIAIVSFMVFTAQTGLIQILLLVSLLLTCTSMHDSFDKIEAKLNNISKSLEDFKNK